MRKGPGHGAASPARSRQTHVRCSILLALLLAACAASSPGSAGEQSSLPVEGSSQQSGSPTPSWLAGVPSYTYKEQACSPTDPRLVDAGIKLPEGEGETARIAAACVALEWLANEGVAYPPLDIIAPEEIGDRAVATLQSSAKAQFRLYWKFRNPAVTTPSVFVFDSITFLCSEGPKYFDRKSYFLNRTFESSAQAAGDPGSASFSCADTSRTWTCDNKPDAADGQPEGAWLQPGRGGNIMLVCPRDLSGDLAVVQHKFYQGIVIRCADHSAYPFCAHWEQGADYLFTYYAERLSNESYGAAGDMNICARWKDAPYCSTGATLFRAYIPSSAWMTVVPTYCWPGSAPYGTDGDCTETERIARVADIYAFEWVTAHFGLEAAYGLLAHSRAAGSDANRYRLLLSAATGMSADALFGAIDAYVSQRLGDRIR